jgi:hypothetical protein
MGKGTGLQIATSQWSLLSDLCSSAVTVLAGAYGIGAMAGESICSTDSGHHRR